MRYVKVIYLYDSHTFLNQRKEDMCSLTLTPRWSLFEHLLETFWYFMVFKCKICFLDSFVVWTFLTLMIDKSCWEQIFYFHWRQDIFLYCGVDTFDIDDLFIWTKGNKNLRWSHASQATLMIMRKIDRNYNLKTGVEWTPLSTLLATF